MRNLEKLSSLKEYIPKMGEPNAKSVAILIDGPNMLRKEFGFDLDVIKEILKEYGNIKVGKVFLNQYASDKLIEAIVNQGMSPIIVAGDIDVQMAVEAFEAIRNPNIDVVALMTRNTDFLPLVNIAKENGKETIVIGAEPGFSIALKNSADSTIVLKKQHSHSHPHGAM
ncbi:TIGR00288 family NYN domain-containing protein [Methanobacterium petrolearium]|uniref:TIGR00288 family NYN domain-containing protein n=1 Tax=Methanobacterium petrolearium TaxID=710190 RepID=UPI001AEA8346|nr:TIGR00288 family NYN domain-containing protein [Methanobacterium petrolearium]MBP1946851.1 uncharacterized protein (TIGR00288 family) [Methanobacterium petrolearium]BDZ70463.1 NYN domain-containing protein [Methanobacterium petrolearium]